MQSKLKICSNCGDPCRLWISTPRLCKNCAGLIKMRDRAKNITLSQTDDGKEAKPFKVIPKFSKNRVEALKIYRRRRDKYFEEHPVCEYPGCTSKNITLHHKKGRIGAFLTDKRHFCSLCLKHHRFVEENPQEGRKLGLILSRLASLVC